ncbi:hypothetical protein GGTG_10853 [Gaeumannomyces tritici R3-111a-1]|uniref:Lipid droplet-associated hydrolase n=1 Tax=Gaeumannomyces tritici (strain R3-111a-1) TaxID=644352 RepID=J3PBI1_GAET3|nr:hypothetical protein GGTG_10853 [Gaeumannomyces tritici R3-111a-1]EJT71598.1 hypothetical protein GGTG_10853 [Gaeumannomyces tritici R3-111a-1]
MSRSPLLLASARKAVTAQALLPRNNRSQPRRAMHEAKVQPAAPGRPASLFLPSSTAPPPPSPSRLRRRRQRRGLVFFIPGNPGLIGYYVPFLSHLRRLLDEAERRDNDGGGGGGGGGEQQDRMALDVFGTSLAGFDDADHAPPFALPASPPRDVEHQVRFVADLVAERDALFSSSSVSAAVGGEEGGGYDAIILMGHSLGTYLACEVLHRDLVARRKGDQQQQQHQQQSRPRLRAGVLLMPTITHMARSPSGRRLDAVRQSKTLDRWAHVAAAVVLAPWPRWLLALLLRRAWGMAPHGAATTAAWLKSRDGVWQALHMGKDEMVVIAEDRWAADRFWGGGVEGAVVGTVKEGEEEEGKRDGVRPPRFYMFYGKDDHWISDEIRDEFIAARRGQKGVAEGECATIVLDESGVIPHDFCINYSEPVAEKVIVWLDELAEQL